MNTDRLDAILPAGGRISGSFAERAGTDVKALIRVGENTLLERLIGIIRSMDFVQRIVVIGPEQVAGSPAASLADTVVAERASGPENVLRGIEWLEKQGGCTAPRVLIMTTDLPFVGREDIEGFLHACDPDADLSAPLVGMPEFREQFPGSTNVGVRLRDGEWTMGCAFLANPTVLIENRERIEQVFVARKSQFAMARLLGLPFALRFLTRRLTAVHIERRCSDLLGFTARAIRGSSPALAFDIDCREDYEYAIGRSKEACDE